MENSWKTHENQWKTDVQLIKLPDVAAFFQVLPPPANAPIGNATLNISECSADPGYRGSRGVFPVGFPMVDPGMKPKWVAGRTCHCIQICLKKHGSKYLIS